MAKNNGVSREEVSAFLDAHKDATEDDLLDELLMVVGSSRDAPQDMRELVQGMTKQIQEDPAAARDELERQGVSPGAIDRIFAMATKRD